MVYDIMNTAARWLMSTLHRLSLSSHSIDLMDKKNITTPAQHTANSITARGQPPISFRNISFFKLQWNTKKSKPTQQPFKHDPLPKFDEQICCISLALTQFRENQGLHDDSMNFYGNYFY
jgi:hypothetical protein